VSAFRVQLPDKPSVFGTDSITVENRLDALDVLRNFSTQIPRAAAPRRLALTVATGVLILL